MMNKFWMGFLLFAMVVIFSGCQAEPQNTAVPQSEIHIGILPDVESIPLLIAESNGYFADAGVLVNLEIFRSARDRDSALQSGQLDGMVTDMVAVFFANEGGFPLRMLAATDGVIYWMAGKDAAVGNISEAEFYSVGLSLNTVMEYTLDAMLKQGGISISTVNKIAIPQIPTRLEMLQNGLVDLALLPEPWSSMAVESGAKIITSTDELGHKAGVIAFDESFVNTNPEAITAVFQAYNQAVEYLNTAEPNDYLDLVIEQFAFPDSVALMIQLPVYKEASLPEANTFNLVQSWLREKTLIQKEWSYDQLVVQNILKE